MIPQQKVAMHDRYVISPTFLFRWEESQEAHVLLYPEGVVKLNDTAANILMLCNGEATVEALVDGLQSRYAAERDLIAKGVIDFLEVSHAKGWIRLAP